MKAGTFLYGSIEKYTLVTVNETRLLHPLIPACAGMMEKIAPSLPHRRQSRALLKHDSLQLSFLPSHFNF